MQSATPLHGSLFTPGNVLLQKRLGMLLFLVGLSSVSLFLFEGQGLLIQVIHTGGVGKLVDSEQPESVRLHMDNHSRRKGRWFTGVYIKIYKFPSYPPSSLPSNPIKDFEC